MKLRFIAGLIVLAGISTPVLASTLPRYAHTSTLLPNGDILVVGGIVNGSPSPDVFLVKSTGGVTQVASLPTARSSHTATLVTQGQSSAQVFVMGGYNGSSAIGITEEYDPASNTWHTKAPLANPRMNHTATTLSDATNGGKVLACGGHGTGGAVRADCELYDPSANSWAAAVAMTQHRAFHTATLLPDGRVFLAGGTDGTTYWDSTEFYYPSNNSLLSARPMNQARAYHTATLLANGKIFIAGGYDGRLDIAGARLGYLESAEIYDPSGAGTIDQAPMFVRRDNHTATLDADGSVKIMGGLGNMTTSYIQNLKIKLTQNSSTLEDSRVSGTTNPAVGIDLPLSSATVGQINYGSPALTTGSTLYMNLNFPLSVAASGMIYDGDIFFSSPSVSFTNGQAWFTPGDSSSRSGLHASLAGVPVQCLNGTCGIIQKQFAVQVANGQGTMTLAPHQDVSMADGSVLKSGANVSQITYTTPFPQGSSPAFVVNDQTSISDGDLYAGTVTVSGLPPEFLGAHVSSGILYLTGGSIATRFSNGDPRLSFSITSGRSLTFDTDSSHARTVQMDNNGIGYVILNDVHFDNIAGIVTVSTPSVNPSPAFDGTETVTDYPFSSLAGNFTYMVDSVDLTNKQFSADIATVVIRSMGFADEEEYHPNTNAWQYSVHLSTPRFNHTATLAPSGSIRFIGGQTSPGSPVGVSFQVETSYPFLNAWASGAASLSTSRYNHTTTLLPSGKLLVAGGTNGGATPFSSAELFDPVANAVAPTGSMASTRDLHTATLLPNGRVLAAGGYTTLGGQTVSISSAEIYYPDTGLWIPTSPMKSNRSQHTAVLMTDGNVMAAGGYASVTQPSTTTVEIYYSTSASWGYTAAMNVARTLHTATLLSNGQVLVVGGQGITSRIAEIYSNGSWSTVASPPLNAGRSLFSHTATLLPDGRVLVAGGNDGSWETNAAYLYDPAANAWSTASPLGTARYNHTATLLPNGQVLVAGGVQAVSELGSPLSSAEIYDVAAGAWSSPASFATLAAPMAYHTMTLASNNSVYLIGGYGGSGAASTIQSDFYAETPDAYSVGGSPTLRVASMTAVTPTIFSTQMTVTGSNFKGVTEASGGGSASANSDHHHPRLILQAMGDSGFLVDLTTQIYTNNVTYPNGLWSTIDSSITVALAQSTIPFGWYQVRVGANAQLSQALLVQSGPPKPASGATSPAATAISTNSITYTWSATGTDSNGYNIYQATSGVWVATAPSTSYTFTGLTPSATHQIEVLPYSITGDAAPTSLAVSATYYTLPNAPAAPAVGTITFNSVQLAWSSNSNGQGTLYEISYATSADFSAFVSTPYPTAVGITTTTVTVTPLDQSTTYYFRVRAANLAGSFSVFTATVSAWTRASVTNVQGVADSTASIRWQWTSAGAGVTYNVYYTTSPGAHFATVPACATACTFEDSGLGVNSLRSLQVSAVTSGGEGTLSTPTTVYTWANLPVDAHVNPVTSTGSITISWSGANSSTPPGSNPAGTLYKLRLTTGTDITISTFTLSTMTSQGLGTQSFSFGGLSPAQVYTIGVQSYNGDGISLTTTTVWPVLISTWTQAQTPANLRITGTTPSSISVAWDANGNTSSATYQVTYTTSTFDQYIATAVFFSQGFSSTTTTITGLLTSTTYTIQVQAQNPLGLPTAYSNSQTTITFNGGGALGSLALLASSLKDSSISGTIGLAPNTRAVTLRATAGSFPSDTTLTVSTYPATTASPCSNGNSHMAFSVTPSPSLQPVNPLFFTLAYDPVADGIADTSHLVMMRYDPVGGQCVPVPTTVDTVGRTLTVQLNHLSIYQVASITAAASPDTARIYPNPFYTATDGYVTIDQIPTSARVRIFTLLGEMLLDQTASASGIVTWKGVGRGGRPVASGVYFVVIEGNGKKILKLAIIR